jgi:membrane-bound serine protease (ClpP class)
VAAIIRSRRRKVVTGREGLLGASGVVRRAIEPGKSGFVLTQGELWQASSPDGRLGEGDRVEVVGVDGLELRVRRVSEALPPAPRAVSPALAKSRSKPAGVS